MSAVEAERLCLVADEGDAQLVLHVFHTEREVTVDIGDGRCDDTIGGIDFNDVRHHNRAEVIDDGTADDIACLLGKCIDN